MNIEIIFNVIVFLYRVVCIILIPTITGISIREIVKKGDSIDTYITILFILIILLIFSYIGF